jgi:hypothetical protein
MGNSDEGVSALPAFVGLADAIKAGRLGVIGELGPCWNTRQIYLQCRYRRLVISPTDVRKDRSQQLLPMRKAVLIIMVVDDQYGPSRMSLSPKTQLFHNIFSLFLKVLFPNEEYYVCMYIVY